MKAPAILAASAMALAAWTGAAGASSAPRLYTAQQAQEGARVYVVRCAVCHGTRLEGSADIPGLTGRFVANWAGRPVADLFDYVGQAMPQSAPGSLSAQDNARLTAYILQANGYTAGEMPLPAEAARLRRVLPAPGMDALR
jgi:mono/diheme cytochrome c family protein